MTAPMLTVLYVLRLAEQFFQVDTRIAGRCRPLRKHLSQLFPVPRILCVMPVIVAHITVNGIAERLLTRCPKNPARTLRDIRAEDACAHLKRYRAGFQDWFASEFGGELWEPYYYRNHDIEPVKLDGFDTDVLTTETIKYIKEYDRDEPAFHGDESSGAAFSNGCG